MSTAGVAAQSALSLAAMNVSTLAKVSKDGRLAGLRIGSLYWGLSLVVRRFLPLATVAVAFSALYLFELDGVGVLGPDEPRYAAIGRSMASTGDFVTPRLWGAPWFEKPPLLYWMDALGTISGLNPDLAGRLPVALLSLAFLAVFFVALQRELSLEAASVATALLATSAGWITYSRLCLTDLPLAVFFSLAVLCALGLVRNSANREQQHWRMLGIGVSLGLACLAKGLVPIALAAPFFWFLRRYWRSWWIAVAGCAFIALPWYIAVYARNGTPFLEDFFLKHHFERLYSVSLQHVQPWYYYFPVLLVGLFPWTPLIGLFAVSAPASAAADRDQRRPFLASVVIFGFVFFSLTLNKLPGYLLPLLPSLFALLGARIDWRLMVRFSRAWLIPCALLIATIPLLGTILPASLSMGRFSLSALKPPTRTEWFYIALPLVVVILARRSWAGLLLVLCVVSGVLYVKSVADPQLDTQVSARGLWRRLAPISDHVCDEWANRDWIFGLSFYRGALIPPCRSGKFDYFLISHSHGQPAIEPIK